MTAGASVLSLPWDPVSASISCGASQHEIRWHRGRVVLCDHDVQSELALRALGGHTSECARILFTWRDYRLEPLLLGSLISGQAGMLSRQTLPVFGPSIGRPGRPGLFGMLCPLVELPVPLRRRLAAASAVSLSRSHAVAHLLSDDRLVVRTVLRDCMTAALQSLQPGTAFEVLVEVDEGPSRPLLFWDRRSGGGLVLRGRLPVEWLALFACGLGSFEGDLVTSVWPGRRWSIVERVRIDRGRGELPGEPRRVRVATDELLAGVRMPDLVGTERW